MELIMQSQAKAAAQESALGEKANRLTRQMGLESLQYIERDLDNLPQFSHVASTEITQQVEPRPSLNPHFTTPGPAIEKPYDPSGVSGNNVPFNTRITGHAGDEVLTPLYPFTQAPKPKASTAKPSGAEDGGPPGDPSGNDVYRMTRAPPRALITYTPPTYLHSPSQGSCPREAQAGPTTLGAAETGREDLMVLAAVCLLLPAPWICGAKGVTTKRSS